jgi:hypothetical protein
MKREFAKRSFIIYSCYLLDICLRVGYHYFQILNLYRLQILKEDLPVSVPKKFQIMLVVVALLSITMIGAVPQPAEAGQAAQDVSGMALGRVTIVNDSDKPAYLYLWGDNYYYFSAYSGETKTYTPEAGEYDYELISCGIKTKGTLTLSSLKRFVIPECGSKGLQQPNTSRTIDAGRLLKLTKVKLLNQTDGYMIVILRGPSEFVFSMDDDETMDITIPKGYYEYTMYGCGGTQVGNLYAYPYTEKEFVCK